MDHEQQIEHLAGEVETIKHYNPVEVRETVGLVLMSVLTFALFIALLRSEARNRALMRELFCD
jgi:hypothetical protein